MSGDLDAGNDMHQASYEVAGPSTMQMFHEPAYRYLNAALLRIVGSNGENGAQATSEAAFPLVRTGRLS